MADTRLFETERLILGPFEPVDLPALHEHLNHPDLAGRRYLPWQFPEDLPLTDKQIEGIYDRWSGEERTLHLAVRSREGLVLIGHAELEWDWDPHCPYLALVIAPPCQRQGYGSEALHCLLRYLFENTSAHNVTGWVADWNQPALDFAQKHGFQLCGRSRREGMRMGAYYDGMLFDILRPEWRARQAGG